MLVVISILGILAAVVTMSMVGVTNLAQSRADDAEKRTIQVALDTMANEQQLDASAVCTGATQTTPNSDMSTFPVPQPGTTPAGTAVPLYPRYLRTKGMHKSYTCDGTGVVTQH
jgi:type II secretory pathway pseudopilin PulG